MVLKTSASMKPTYYAVIFTSVRTDGDNGYGEMSERMEELVRKQPWFLGMEAARNEVGITVCYWESLESILNWKQNLEHQHAQKLGYEKWYTSYNVKICKVKNEYGF